MCDYGRVRLLLSGEIGVSLEVVVAVVAIVVVAERPPVANARSGSRRTDLLGFNASA